MPVSFIRIPLVLVRVLVLVGVVLVEIIAHCAQRDMEGDGLLTQRSGLGGDAVEPQGVGLVAVRAGGADVLAADLGPVLDDMPIAIACPWPRAWSVLSQATLSPLLVASSKPRASARSTNCRAVSPVFSCTLAK